MDQKNEFYIIKNLSSNVLKKIPHSINQISHTTSQKIEEDRLSSHRAISCWTKMADGRTAITFAFFGLFIFTNFYLANINWPGRACRSRCDFIRTAHYLFAKLSFNSPLN
ncbi:hypothetical protein BpHYR1_033188 [Brachionus plicatilis]|uniref:Uncharacterized protein n=1 Tax=Brachionus plicatilis TaxID=10195 RepID=A0A3M7QD42_BRAPC|nr:hypothetical protein BpHYR1_033188 [Brachionus plicatilis]